MKIISVKKGIIVNSDVIITEEKKNENKVILSWKIVAIQ